LPRAGGILDQPYGLMKRLTFLYNVYMGMKQWRNTEPEKKADFISNDPAYKIVELISKLREERGQNG